MPCVSVEVSSDFCCFKLALPMSFDMDNSDGKASLKQQKSINQYDVQV